MTNELTNTKKGSIPAGLPRGAGALHERLFAARQTAQIAGGAGEAERIILMLDYSGSMSTRDGEGSDIPFPVHTGKTRHEILLEAADAYLQNADIGRNGVGIETFPERDATVVVSNSYAYVRNDLYDIPPPAGGTPMLSCLRRVLAGPPPTRCVIVSDGDATDLHMRFGAESLDETLERYHEAKIAIDCVHIGPSASGEATLSKIARETGGIYLKFTDTASLVKGLKFLTPRYRALLMAPNAAQLTGATEVKT